MRDYTFVRLLVGDLIERELNERLVVDHEVEIDFCTGLQLFILLRCEFLPLTGPDQAEVA